MIMTKDESQCELSESGVHCDCWWDGGSCCECDAPAVTAEDLVENGEIERVEEFEEYWKDLNRLLFLRHGNPVESYYPL